MSHETVKPLFEDASASRELHDFVVMARGDGASQADLDRLARRIAPVVGVSAAVLASTTAAAIGTAPVAAVGAFGAPSSGLTPALGGVVSAAKAGAGAAKAGLFSQLLASTSAKLVALGLSVGAVGVGVYSMKSAESPPAGPRVPVARHEEPARTESARVVAAAPAPPQAAAADQVGAHAQSATGERATARPTQHVASARNAAGARKSAAVSRPVRAEPAAAEKRADEPAREESPSAAQPPAPVAKAEPPPAPSAPPPSELSLIERAEALRARPTEALAFLAKHQQLYPHGVLAQEREVLAIELLLKAKKLELAETRAERFADDYPGSAHLPRLRALLARAAAK